MNATTKDAHDEHGVEVPAPTIYPFFAAVGLALAGAGWVTHPVVSLLGAAFALHGAIGWTRTVYSEHSHTHVPRGAAPSPIEPVAAEVEETRDPAAPLRALHPELVHPYASGARGGILGGLVMIVVALGYGVISGHGIWYPVNLLAGAVVPSAAASAASLEQFHLSTVLVGTGIHAAMSVGLGFLYATLLPMLPGRPIVWGGLLAPLLWSGILHSAIAIVDPLLAARVSWPWFVASQLGYGIMVGFIVERHEKVATRHPSGGP